MIEIICKQLLLVNSTILGQFGPVNKKKTMHCRPSTQSFLHSLLEPQFLMCRITGGAQTHPIYPREEVVVVHKVARSLLGPVLSSRVGNWEPLSMGRYTIYVKQKLLFDKCEKQVCSAEAGQSQTASEMHPPTLLLSLPHPTFTLLQSLHGFQFPINICINAFRLASCMLPFM